MKKELQDRYRTGEIAFTPREVELLKQKAPNREDELIILMGIGTALRREDLAIVTIENINLQEGTLHFHEQKKDRRERPTRGPGGKRIPGKVIEERWRTIPLTPKLIEALGKYISSLPKDQDYLFPMTGRTMYNHLQAICDRAKVKRRPFHALRATMIKRAQRAGWPPEAVAKFTGDRLDTIQAHYSVPSEGEMKEISEKELI